MFNLFNHSNVNSWSDNILIASLVTTALFGKHVDLNTLNTKFVVFIWILQENVHLCPSKSNEQYSAIVVRTYHLYPPKRHQRNFSFIFRVRILWNFFMAILRVYEAPLWDDINLDDPNRDFFLFFSTQVDAWCHNSMNTISSIWSLQLLMREIAHQKHHVPLIFPYLSQNRKSLFYLIFSYLLIFSLPINITCKPSAISELSELKKEVTRVVLLDHSIGLFRTFFNEKGLRIFDRWKQKNHLMDKCSHP